MLLCYFHITVNFNSLQCVVLHCLLFRYWSRTVTLKTRQQAKTLSAASNRWTLVIRTFPSSHSRWLEMLCCTPQLLEQGIQVARVKYVIPIIYLLQGIYSMSIIVSWRNHHYEPALNTAKMKCDSPGRERHAGRKRHIHQINTQ